MSDQLLSPTSIHPALNGPKHNNNNSNHLRHVDQSHPVSLAAALVSATPSDSTTTKPSSTYNQGHHRNSHSIESVPRQTLIKALASSVARNNKPQALSLPSMLSNNSTAGAGDARPGTSSSQLCDALNDLALRSSGAAGVPARTPTTALPALQSPCFYHQRFDGIVDIDKVLEEIKNDEWMSHSRLVQTATGVREVSKQLQRRPIKRAVRNVMIVTKARDNTLVVLTRELAQWLMRTPRYGSDLGVNVFVDAKLRGSKRFDAPGIVAENPRFQHMLKYWTPDLCWSQPEKFDLVLTLGGDGTVLFTSWLFQRIVPPVLSFSLGSLGFLTTFEYERFRDHLNRVMGDDGMKINLRMRFTCTVYRDGAMGREMEEGEQFEVLNELVIDRGPSPYVSNLELYGDNELLTVVQADGCIFSTPTGSTAYSLSAGGSLVHPDLPAILLTPICPHTLSFRPMVLSDTMLLRVSVPRNSRATAYCAFDGKGRVELRQGDCVTIAASQYPFPTVTRTDTEWFDSVSRTLRWNVRAATQKGFDAGGGDCTPASEYEGDECGDWDIDTDSACYASEEGSASASPLRRQMSLLGM
ncbi:ATP-NAD kinase [Cryphonectria parasitica EP155]|uniref:ATP-NAD kinase n=1 Tax=Cryphonectria parasitica (strain ATCC 38755 / EP155) TaxID=660469 RepID=A0A9P4Y959_CRYP1|nr:ATP-NAD kinase [Cryphonectria parasitica EP155]KAF3769093.1 ATP-NAD kinase [Cryphonectria parasitica EP155]